MSLWSQESGFARETLPFILMEDIYDLLTLSQCEEIFDIFEERYEILREYICKARASGRFLKANNSLLSRLSHCINIELKGRVLVFMALCISLNDKSGLNLKGDINLENVTEVEEESENSELPDEMDISSASDHHQPIDYNFYRTFWGLQNYFQKPSNIVSSSSNFVSFMNVATSVINAFSTSPIHHPTRAPNAVSFSQILRNNNFFFLFFFEQKDSIAMEIDSEGKGDVLDSCPPFFKYLTSTRLLHIQVSKNYTTKNVFISLDS